VTCSVWKAAAPKVRANMMMESILDMKYLIRSNEVRSEGKSWFGRPKFLSMY